MSLPCVTVIAYNSQFCLYQTLLCTSVVILLRRKEQAELWRQRSVLCVTNSDWLHSTNPGQVGCGSRQLYLVCGIPTHGRGSGTRWRLRRLSNQTILWFYVSEHDCETQKLERWCLISRIHLGVRACDSRGIVMQWSAKTKALPGLCWRGMLGAWEASVLNIG